MAAAFRPPTGKKGGADCVTSRNEWPILGARLKSLPGRRAGPLFAWPLHWTLKFELNVELMAIKSRSRYGSDEKAAEDSRTPRRYRACQESKLAIASWSAAVLCRFHQLRRFSRIDFGLRTLDFP